MQETTSTPSYGKTSRGVTGLDVEQAADALLRSGQRPTIARVRAKLGTGSPNTINPLLDAWWKTLAARLDSGPAALQRLPEAVAHLAEGLWLRALDEGRRRAAMEQQVGIRAQAIDKQQLEIRSHVLSLREGELESRLHDRDRAVASLESQLQVLTTQLRREQATRESQARHIATLEHQLSAQTQKPPPRSRISALSRSRRRPKKTRAAEPVKKSSPNNRSVMKRMQRSETR